MNSILLVLLLATVAAASQRSYPAYDLNSRILREMEMIQEMEDNLPMSRSRRVPAPGDTRVCGKKLVMYVFAVCGAACEPHDGRDIATACCAGQCDDDYIRSACCP